MSSKTSTKSKADYTHKRQYSRFNPQSDFRNAFFRSFQWEWLISCRSNFYCPVIQAGKRIFSCCSKSWLMCKKTFFFPPQKKSIYRKSQKRLNIFHFCAFFSSSRNHFFCVKKSQATALFLMQIVKKLCFVRNNLFSWIPRNFEKKMEDEASGLLRRVSFHKTVENYSEILFLKPKSQYKLSR